MTWFIAMTDPEELTDASIEGRQAYRSGQPREACNYPLGTAFRRHWLNGWDMARAGDNKESDR